MKPNQVISIVFSEEVVDFVELSLKGDKNTVLSVGSYGFSYDNIDQFNETATAISDMVGKNKYTRLSIVHQDVLRTTLIVDNGGDIKSKILQNFKQTFDIQLSDYYVDFVTTPLDKGSLVFISALPKRLVDPILDVLKKNNFKLLSLEPGISSALRAVEVQFHHDVFLHLHIDYFRMVITICSHGMVYAVRYISFGFEDMISTLADAGGVSMDDSEALFYKYGTLDLDSDDEVEQNIHSSILDATDKISMEIQRTIDFYSMTYKRSDIGDFVVSGVLNKLPGFDKYLSKLFSVNVDFSQSTKLLSVEDEHMSVISEMNGAYLCIGAGLR